MADSLKKVNYSAIPFFEIVPVANDILLTDRRAYTGIKKQAIT